jgi:hypothetical protein
MISVIKNEVEQPIAQIIFAHGAGANMEHVYMENFTHLLNAQQINVLRFNFPYMDKRAETGKRYPPDRMPKLLDCYQQVIKDYLATQANKKNRLPLFIGGKSMGSRVAATLIGDEKLVNDIAGVFCIGYPFHPAKKEDKLRLEPLQETLKPVLILQGDRDALGSKAEIATYALSKQCQCVFFEDGDHDLKPRVKSGFKLEDHLLNASKILLEFVNEYSS